jgi:hypothetical protein
MTLLWNAPIAFDADTSNDVDCDKEVSFEDSSKKVFPGGNYPFPELCQGHFACESRNSNNF